MNLIDLKPVCGIYKITNTVTGKVYVGQSVNIKYRWANHVSALTSDKTTGSNKELIEDFKKFGLDAFVGEVLEECKKEELIEREAVWIKELHEEKISIYNKGYLELRLINPPLSAAEKARKTKEYQDNYREAKRRKESARIVS